MGNRPSYSSLDARTTEVTTDCHPFGHLDRDFPSVHSKGLSQKVGRAHTTKPGLDAADGPAAVTVWGLW
jgi:hypothetical protein